MIEPNQLAEAWYLKFGNEWVTRDELEEDWVPIAKQLMKNDYLQYELSYWRKGVSKGGVEEGSAMGVTEIYKLRGD